MNEIEIGRWQICKHIVRDGLQKFYEVGEALLEIRDSRLYRNDYSTFEECCSKEWGISRPRAYQLMDAAGMVDRLSTIVDILPTTESQARPLAILEPDQQVQAWQKAIEIAPEGKITAAIVQGVVNDFNYKRDMRRTSVQNIYVPLGMDACQTPGYAIDPLLPYLAKFDTIWEPAAGEGLLVDALLDCSYRIFTVLGSDILDGRNFF